MKRIKESKMNEDKIKADIINKIEFVAKALKQGKDVELRKTASGISVTEINKKVVAR